MKARSRLARTARGFRVPKNNEPVNPEELLRTTSEYWSSVRSQHEKNVAAERDDIKYNTARVKFGDWYDPNMPRDPKAAEGSAVYDLVVNKRPRSLPTREYQQVSLGEHPGLPNYPRGTGETMLQDTGPVPEEIETDEDALLKRHKAAMSLKAAQDQKAERERQRNEEYIRSRIAERMENSPLAGRIKMQQLEAEASKPSIAVEETPAVVIPTPDQVAALSLQGSSAPDQAGGGAQAGAGTDEEAVQRGIKNMKVSPASLPDKFVTELPPVPNKVAVTSKLTIEEQEYVIEQEHARIAREAMTYDDAYEAWKKQKLLDKRRRELNLKRGRLSVQSPEEKEAENKKFVEAETKLKAAEEDDPLLALEREMHPELEEEERREAEEFEKKKEAARLNLKRLPNTLTLELKKTIQRHGPMTIANYIKNCLYHAGGGYYTTKDANRIFGRQGDFVTSPEVSIMFGECIAAWCHDTYTKLGSPKEFHLVEFGAGQGTLMSRVLKGTQAFADFSSAARPKIVEVSDVLQKKQFERIKDDNGEEVAAKVEWSESVEGLGIRHSNIPVIAFCNEFFDCFPINKLQYTERGWVEWFVENDDDPASPDHFKFVLSPGETATVIGAIPHELREYAKKHRKLGMTVELQLEAYRYLETVLQELVRCNGAFLVCDYGEDDYIQDSLRAIKVHEFVSPLESPGEVDLSSDVSFKMFRKVVDRNARLSQKIHVSDVMQQGEFLKRTGIQVRAAFHIGRIEQARYAGRIAREYEKLTDTTSEYGMGKKFKFMCFSTKEPEKMVPPCPW